MIPFRISFRTGSTLCEQIVYAVKKAAIAGHIRPGDPFPSVRVLGRELKINPNTAHKVVTQLVNEGVLEVQRGTGTFVAVLPPSTAHERTHLLGNEIEQLVVEAKRLGVELDSILAAVSKHWKKLGGTNEQAHSLRNKEDARKHDIRNQD